MFKNKKLGFNDSEPKRQKSSFVLIVVEKHRKVFLK